MLDTIFGAVKRAVPMAIFAVCYLSLLAIIFLS